MLQAQALHHPGFDLQHSYPDCSGLNGHHSGGSVPLAARDPYNIHQKFGCDLYCPVMQFFGPSCLCCQHCSGVAAHKHSLVQASSMIAEPSISSPISRGALLQEQRGSPRSASRGSPGLTSGPLGSAMTQTHAAGPLSGPSSIPPPITSSPEPLGQDPLALSPTHSGPCSSHLRSIQ